MLLTDLRHRRKWKTEIKTEMSNGVVEAGELLIKGTVYPFARADLIAEERGWLPDTVHKLLMHGPNSIVRSVGGQSNRRSKQRMRENGRLGQYTFGVPKGRLSLSAPVNYVLGACP